MADLDRDKLRQLAEDDRVPSNRDFRALLDALDRAEAALRETMCVEYRMDAVRIARAYFAGEE